MKITWGGKDKQDGEDDEGEKEEEDEEDEEEEEDGEMGMERGRRSRISTGTPEEGEQRGLEYIEYNSFFNLSHGHKCPFGSLAPPPLTLLRRPWISIIIRSRMRTGGVMCLHIISNYIP